MRVEIEVNPDITEETAILRVPKMTSELMAIVEMLEDINDHSTQDKSHLLVAKKDDKVFLIDPNKVDIIRTEGGKIILYDHKAQAYALTKSLSEILEQLPSQFVRISKSAIVNTSRVDHLSTSFDRTMYIIMENGVHDYITRKYLGDFKARLGM